MKKILSLILACSLGVVSLLPGGLVEASNLDENTVDHENHDCMDHNIDLSLMDYTNVQMLDVSSIDYTDVELNLNARALPLILLSEAAKRGLVFAGQAIIGGIIYDVAKSSASSVGQYLVKQTYASKQYFGKHCYNMCPVHR